MRLAVLSYGLPVPGEKRGGIERVAHMLAEGLAARGHHVSVFSHDPAPAGASYQRRPLPWESFVRTWAGRRLTMGYLGNVMMALPDYREFDAIIAHGDSLCLPLKGKPVIRIMHGSALGEARHATSAGRFVLQLGVYVQELLTALTLPATVAVSENTRRHNPFVRHVIPNGVDTTAFFPDPAHKTSVPSVVFVGTATGRKRGRFMLETFRRSIRATFPAAELAFVGPAAEPIPGVSYHVGVDDTALGTLYRRAWVCASPSTYEGFGLPYLEAMACGTAVVATPNPGSREVLADGRYGVLAEDDDFAEAVIRLLDDAPARRARETAGLERARELSLDIMIDKYERLLSGLLASHARSAASA